MTGHTVTSPHSPPSIGSSKNTTSQDAPKCGGEEKASAKAEPSPPTLRKFGSLLRSTSYHTSHEQRKQTISKLFVCVVLKKQVKDIFEESDETIFPLKWTVNRPLHYNQKGLGNPNGFLN